MTLRNTSCRDDCTDDIIESRRSNSAFRQKCNNTKSSCNAYTVTGRIRGSKISEDIKASSIIKFPLLTPLGEKWASIIPAHSSVCPSSKFPQETALPVLALLTQICPVSSSHCPSARGLNPKCNAPTERARSVCGRKSVCVCVCQAELCPMVSVELRSDLDIMLQTVFMAGIYSDHTENL